MCFRPPEAVKKLKCPSCSAIVPIGKTCVKCGAELPQDKPK